VAADMQQALPRIQLLAPETDEFRDPEPMPEREPPSRRAVAISCSISACARCSRAHRLAFVGLTGGAID
jgi:hypothetical protein